MKQVKEMGIVAVCLMLLGFGICMGIGTYLMYRDGEEEYNTLREYVAVEEPKENAGSGFRTPRLIIRLCRGQTMNII